MNSAETDYQRKPPSAPQVCIFMLPAATRASPTKPAENQLWASQETRESRNQCSGEPSRASRNWRMAGKCKKEGRGRYTNKVSQTNSELVSQIKPQLGLTDSTGCREAPRLQATNNGLNFVARSCPTLVFTPGRNPPAASIVKQSD